MIRKTTLLIATCLGIAFSSNATEIPENLKDENLVAWCIVPFDAAKRGPEERAKMLKELGIRRSAYDFRQEHVSQFEEEILAYKKHGIELFAFWAGHDEAYRLFKKYDLHPQIWRTLGSPSEGSQEEKVEAAADSMEQLAKKTAELGCQLGLYNHGGWGGDPENMIAVCESLRRRGYDHVGIVYNWHHGHGHIEDWASSLDMLKPYLICLNLNGMKSGADPKILTLSQGDHELGMLRTVIDSGYSGPVGIIDHRNEMDTKVALSNNLKGLEWLRQEIVETGSGGKRPLLPDVSFQAKESAVPEKLETVPSLNEKFGTALSSSIMASGNTDWREPPITVECRAKLSGSDHHILVASDPKKSAAHWEIFAMRGDGTFTAYLPDAKPDHIRSKSVITDGKWHSLAMQYDEDRISLFVDGTKVADQPIKRNKGRVITGNLGIGRLISGGLRMNGAIDEVRIRKGIHDDVASGSNEPLSGDDESVLGFWNFEKDSAVDSFATIPEFPREPLEPEYSPYWDAEINRDRVYDFYAKQAIHYGQMEKIPDVLPAYAGLDGGKYGHWGNQNDQDTWKDGRVRDMDHGSMVSGVFRGKGMTLPRAVSVKLSENVNAVFDEDSLQFVLAWKGDLVEWSDVRRGFMKGIPMGGQEEVDVELLPKPDEDSDYLGLYRVGEKVIFSYSEEGEVKYKTAEVSSGKVIEKLVEAPSAGDAVWPERIETKGEMREGHPYAVDTLTLPFENPWKALFFVAGVDFVSKDRIAICNIHGDVWVCDVSGDELASLTWKRYAAGLHQPLGLKVVDGTVHVLCRDQIVALHDRNSDDEADYYECVTAAWNTSPGAHDFITGLQKDDQGRWYTASGNQGVIRISSDGDDVEVLGTGLRNPNGLGISPDGGVILSSVQEGTWTPASAVCDVSLGGHFGAGGPKEGPRGYVPPMIYFPRGIDNSSAEQVYINSDQWGPVEGKWIHLSGGYAKYFLMYREVIDGESQAAAIQLPGSFLSGGHRGRFSPYDGQLYVAGAQGWGNYGTQDGSLQRVRYTAEKYPYPVDYETKENGILLTFESPQADEVFEKKNWFAQQWNYLYAPAYGSPEYSVSHPAQAGHDVLGIRSIQKLDGGKKVFIELPQLQPVNQLHLHCNVDSRIEIFATVHHLGEPFTEFPGYEKIEKVTLTQAAAPERGVAALVAACTACHHPTKRVVGPPFAEIRQRYAGNPDGIVKWAMNPENKNPELPPMPKFDFLGEETLREIADWILSGD